MAQQDASAQSTSSASIWSKLRRSVGPLLPGLIGLACSRVTIMVINSGDTLQTDGDMLTDAMSVVKCLPLIVLLIVLVAFGGKAKYREWGTGAKAGFAFVAVEALSLAALTAAEAIEAPDTVRSIVGTAGSVVGTLVTFYWITQARGLGPARAVLFIALGRVFAEPVITALTVFPISGHLVAVAALLGQALCVRALGGRGALVPQLDSNLSEKTTDQPKATRFFSGFEDELKDRKILISCTVCCILLSAAAGLLRAFPDGMPIFSTMPIYLTFSALTIVAYLALSLFALRHSPLLVVASAWFAIELLGIASVFLYSVVPDELAYGAGTSRLFNDTLHALRQYIAIALMTLGWRNPYFYLTLTYLIFLFPRAISRTALTQTAAANPVDPALVSALAAVLIVLAGQILFMRIAVLLTKNRVDREQQTPSVMERVLGIDQSASVADIHASAMQQSAQRIGAEFGLSEREVEVLALFASGHTQKQVAEDLFITPSTAHAHIRHIYTKTGFHSRQDILNYLKEHEV